MLYFTNGVFENLTATYLANYIYSDMQTNVLLNVFSMILDRVDSIDIGL